MLVTIAAGHLGRLGLNATADVRARTLTLDGHLFRVLTLESGETRRVLDVLRQVAAQDPTPLLVVSPHFSDKELAALSDAGIAAVDAVGNAHLRHEGLHIDVRGRRPAHTAPARDAVPASPVIRRRPGIAVRFVMLAAPNLATATLRAIAGAAGVSLGTAQGIVRQWHDEGRLNDRGLVEAPALARQWVEDYRRLPERALARLHAPAGWWRDVTEEEARALSLRWGAESAAELLRPHLRTSYGVAYVHTVPDQLLARFRMRALRQEANAADAFAEFRRPLWGRDWHVPAVRDDTVPSLLVYADLLRDGDSRLAEAAADLLENDDALRRLLG